MLPRTLQQTIDIEVGQLGVRGLPNADWPLTTGNDCLKFQLWATGVATRSELQNEVISIGAWLGVTGWQRVPADQIRTGDFIVQTWDDPHDHVGLCYSRPAGAYRSIEANTSPKPGIALTPQNRGIYDKTRPGGEWIEFGVRPPYKPQAAVTSKSQRDDTRLLLGWLDKQLPASVQRSAAGPTHAGPGDGVMGPVAWLELQEWGDLPTVGLYPSPPYQKDGVAGGRTKFLYGEALKRARAAVKK